MGQSNELEREIKQKHGGDKRGASQKSGRAMAHPGPPENLHCIAGYIINLII